MNRVRPVNRYDLITLIEVNGGTSDYIDLSGLDLSGIDIRGMHWAVSVLLAAI